MDMESGLLFNCGIADSTRNFVIFVIGTIIYAFLITHLNSNSLFAGWHDEVFRYNIGFIFGVGFVCFMSSRKIVLDLCFVHKNRHPVYVLVDVFFTIIMITAMHYTIAGLTDYHKYTNDLNLMGSFVNIVLMIFVSLLPYQIYAEYLRKRNLP